MGTSERDLELLPGREESVDRMRTRPESYSIDAGLRWWQSASGRPTIRDLEVLCFYREVSQTFLKI